MSDFMLYPTINYVSIEGFMEISQMVLTFKHALTLCMIYDYFIKAFITFYLV